MAYSFKSNFYFMYYSIEKKNNILNNLSNRNQYVKFNIYLQIKFFANLQFQIQSQ